jgi:hypothetical protein
MMLHSSNLQVLWTKTLQATLVTQTTESNN